MNENSKPQIIFTFDADNLDTLPEWSIISETDQQQDQLKAIGNLMLSVFIKQEAQAA
jgi:hypothetical protein